jgi:hypothetical protein
VSDTATTNVEAPFESFGALRSEHAELRRWFGKAKAGAERVGAADKVRTFLHRAATTGATLSEPGERVAAQAILDFWCSELIGIPNPQPGDFQRVRLSVPLAPPQRTDAETPKSGASPEARDVIRLAATARLWRDLGMKGFLLTGDALNHAERFRGVDDDIDSLVQASRTARRKIVKNYMLISAGFVSLLLVLVVVVPNLAERAIAKLKDEQLKGSGSGDVRSNLLRELSWYQVVQRQPYDLSVKNDAVYENVKTHGLKLNAPNFSAAKFKNVDFQDAEFRISSFSDADIKGPANFKGAKLSLTQFREATIKGADFSGSELYRAIFDAACISDVKFTQADLRQASFFGAEFDAEFAFEYNFKDSPWWLARGWTSHQLAALTNATQDGIASTKGFKDDLDPLRDNIKNTAAGSADRAKLHNEFAWRLATWGVVSRSSSPSSSPPLELTCRSTVEVGANDQALEAAEQAVCVASKGAKSPGNKKLLANFQDSRAYILLQRGHAAQAAEIYSKEVMPNTDGNEFLFRAAVAQQAIGNEAAALDLFRRYVDDGYVPGHELYTLRGYIKGAFQKAVYDRIDQYKRVRRSPAYCEE